MPRGHPDWGYQTEAFGNFELDTSELASRLGSNHKFTRSGRLIFDADFSQGKDIIETAVISGSPTALSLMSRGVFSLGVLNCVQSTAAISELWVIKRLPKILGRRAGLETIFRVTSNPTHYYLVIDKISSTEQIRYAIRIVTLTRRLEYLNSAGVYTDVTEVDYSASSSQIWMLLKLIVNLDTNQYERIIVNDTTIPLAGISARNIGGGSISRRLDFRVQIANTGAQTFDVDIGTFIATIDEP